MDEEEMGMKMEDGCLQCWNEMEEGRREW